MYICLYFVCSSPTPRLASKSEVEMTSTALKANINFQIIYLCLKVIGLESVLASFPKGDLILSKKGVKSFERLEEAILEYIMVAKTEVRIPFLKIEHFFCNQYT